MKFAIFLLGLVIAIGFYAAHSIYVDTKSMELVIAALMVWAVPEGIIVFLIATFYLER
mgnify:CR=1 FL=1